MQSVSGGRLHLSGGTVVGFLAVALFLVFVARRLWGAEVATLAASFVTIAVITWTAYETAALRAETVRQTEIEQAPFVVLVQEGDVFYVENLGRGLALSVRMPETVLDVRHRVVVRLTAGRPLAAVPPGRRVMLDIRSWEATNDAPPYKWQSIDFQRAAVAHPDGCVVFIECIDVTGRTHRFAHTLHRGEFSPSPRD